MKEVKITAKLVGRTKEEPSIAEGGPLKIQPKNVDLLINALKTYKGEEVSVTISDVGDTWTDRMNRLLHALIRLTMDAGAGQYWSMIRRAPETFDEYKEWIKTQFGGAEVKIVGDLCWIESWTKFSKKRAIQTIDNLLQYLLSQGVDVDNEKTEAESLKE
jgi:hypothetical protein